MRTHDPDRVEYNERQFAETSATPYVWPTGTNRIAQVVCKGYTKYTGFSRSSISGNCRCAESCDTIKPASYSSTQWSVAHFRTNRKPICSPTDTRCVADGLTKSTGQCLCGIDNELCGANTYCFDNKCSPTPVCANQNGVTANTAACHCGDFDASLCGAGGYCLEGTCSPAPTCANQDGVTANTEACVCGDDFTSGHPTCPASQEYCGSNICKTTPICPHQNGQVAEGPCWCGGGFGAGSACDSANPYCARATCYPEKLCAYDEGEILNDESCYCGTQGSIEARFDIVENAFGSKFQAYCELEEDTITHVPKCEDYTDDKDSALFDVESCMCYLDNGSKEICESTKDILEITYDNTSPTQYKFEYRLEGLGYCGDGGQHLSPAFPPRLSPGDPLYDEDGAQECMNRCLNKNPNFRAFYTRHNGDYNDQCACAMSCDHLSLTHITKDITFAKR